METLVQVGRFVVVFIAARAMAELMVRIQLPTILGELVAGVIIGVSGFHLLVPPEAHGELAHWLLSLVGSLASVPAETVQEVYTETFPSLTAVSEIGLFALLFLTSLESELDELVAVGMQATTVAITGVVLPFALGTSGLYYLFHVPLFPAVFAGAAMTATSIGITASVFGELSSSKHARGKPLSAPLFSMTSLASSFWRSSWPWPVVVVLLLVRCSDLDWPQWCLLPWLFSSAGRLHPPSTGLSTGSRHQVMLLLPASLCSQSAALLLKQSV